MDHVTNNCPACKRVPLTGIQPHPNIQAVEEPLHTVAAIAKIARQQSEKLPDGRYRWQVRKEQLTASQLAARIVRTGSWIEDGIR